MPGSHHFPCVCLGPGVCPGPGAGTHIVVPLPIRSILSLRWIGVVARPWFRNLMRGPVCAGSGQNVRSITLEFNALHPGPNRPLD